MSNAIVTEEPDGPDEAEPSLQSLLEQLGAGGRGWADLDSQTLGKALEKQMRDQRQALRKEAIHFRECFSTPAGKIVLQSLLDQTLRAVTWPVSAMTDGQMLMSYGIWREGQNAFMASIVEAIALANNSDVKPRSMT